MLAQPLSSADKDAPPARKPGTKAGLNRFVWDMRYPGPTKIDYGLAPPTAPDRLSHLLVRGLEVVEHPAAAPPEARDVVDPATGLLIRLSDHNPVIGTFTSVG